LICFLIGIFIRDIIGKTFSCDLVEGKHNAPKPVDRKGFRSGETQQSTVPPTTVPPTTVPPTTVPPTTVPPTTVPPTTVPPTTVPPTTVPPTTVPPTTVPPTTITREQGHSMADIVAAGQTHHDPLNTSNQSAVMGMLNTRFGIGDYCINPDGYTKATKNICRLHSVDECLSHYYTWGNANYACDVDVYDNSCVKSGEIISFCGDQLNL